MHGVNILIINEKGRDFRFVPHGFDDRLTQTIVLAFRLTNEQMGHASNENRNHYDSVVRIEQNDIFDMAKELALIQLKIHHSNNQTTVDLLKI